MGRNAPAGSRPKAYYVLVSEAMLQQTQVSTATPYFLRFIERFPTLLDLASADPQDVLRVWQGLGYYSRARHLQATAKIVVEQYHSRVPSQPGELLKLPGVGRYTAGAIASLAFDRRAPAVDGNVIRVLCRIDRIEQDPRKADVRQRLWQRAQEILPRKQVGDFNSAMMELGATVCVPRGPRCMACPVRKHCEAHAAGVQQQIPVARQAKARPVVKRWTVCIRRGQRWLLEQRPSKGRWAGMWQFVTMEAKRGRPNAKMVESKTGLAVSGPRAIGKLKHDLSHREYRFEVFVCEAKGRGRGGVRDGRVWVKLEELTDYPLPRAQASIAAMLRASGG